MRHLQRATGSVGGAPVSNNADRCYAESVMFGSIRGVEMGFFFLTYIGLIVLIVWLVVSSLVRISRGVQDIAQILRRMEEKGPPPIQGL